MRSFLFACSIALLLVGFAYTSSPLLHAQSKSVAGIGLKPAVIEDNAAPGEEQKHTVSVTNLSSATQTYYLSLRDIIGVEDGGVPIFADEGQEKTGYELVEWVSLSVNELTIAPGEEKTVDVTIKVPDNATPGSHFGGVFVSMTPPRLRETGAAVGYEVANIISLRVDGDVVVNAQIRAFSTSNFIHSTPKVEFNARVENKGTVLIKPFGPIEIRNMFGTKVASLTLNESKAGIFPLTERPFTVVWENESGGFGRYEAVVSMLYGEQDRQSTISSTTSFWILPLKIILPALGALAFILAVTYISIKLYIRRTMRAVIGDSRRIIRSRRRQGGTSAVLIALIVMLLVTALFLLVLLALYA
jgi:hypothetical protein